MEKAGEVFGYLGPNRAGKTTTLRLLMGLIRPTAGCAAVLGMDSWRDSVEIHRRVGYLQGEAALYDRMSGRQHIELFLPPARYQRPFRCAQAGLAARPRSGPGRQDHVQGEPAEDSRRARADVRAAAADSR